MLPKVANQILHHTSRAVAAVQNQTGQTLRNVFQLQSSSGPSSAAGNLGAWNSTGSSSSGWGSGGPGAGGAKQSSSNRFHSSYSGVGRAATLVDPSFAHATNADSFDDPDEPLLAAPIRTKHRQRSRSSSLSFSIQERDEQVAKFGVLKTVQLHVRSRHAFAAPPLPVAIAGTETVQTEAEDIERPEFSDDGALETLIHEEENTFRDLTQARNSRDLSRVLAEVNKVRETVPTPSAAVWNAALYALVEVRKPDESIQEILKTYHDMISRSVVPNFRTYMTLIEALTTRDWEISEELRSLDARIRLRLAVEGTFKRSYYAERINDLKSENAFGAALTLFQAACMVPRAKLPYPIYINLLRSCASHGNVDAAIHVYAHLEKRQDLRPYASVFKYLIRAYRIGGDAQGTKEVFDEYIAASRDGRVLADNAAEDGILLWQIGAIGVWNEMIEAYFHFGQPAAALGLLEQMMDSPKGLDFEVSDVPLPAGSTFTRVIRGFIRAGDVKSALAWFERLLGQEDEPTRSYQPALNPTRPDASAWAEIIEVLVANSMFDDLTRILRIGDQKSACMTNYMRIIVLRAYIQHYSVHPELLQDAVETLDLVRSITRSALPEVLSKKVDSDTNAQWLHYSFINLYLQCGRPDRALDLLEECSAVVREALISLESENRSTSADVEHKHFSLRTLVQTVGAQILTSSLSFNWSLRDSLRLANQYYDTQLFPPFNLCENLLKAFKRASPAEKDLLTARDWELIVSHNRALLRPAKRDNEQPSPIAYPMPQLLAEVSQRSLVQKISWKVLRLAAQTMSASETSDFLAQLGDEPWAATVRRGFTSTPYTTQQPVSDVSAELTLSQPAGSSPVRIDLQQSKYIEEYFPNNPKVTPLMAFSRFEGGLHRGSYPTPDVISKLINSLGRLGEVEKVRKLYNVSQAVLASLEDHKTWQSAGWFGIEDAMIIALAHSGDADGAHVHRARILEQGGSPSADGYGALIQCVKDTTDDTSNAMALFQEALARGVTPNIYLYNTAISKLAKARKADHALSLFQEMKGRGIRPTSVTYGAVIAACCRVGDGESAEILFQEMSSQPNFKPRVPPYNTMMQLHTHTKPDRERVLYYYNALLEANVRPTAHTYKLLIDAYGTIEPVDTDAMEATFKKLVADPQVPVQGTHWAALINAWGCVRKDLDRAVNIFESIQTHSSTQHSHAALPDAVVFEALMNVLVTLRRADLIPVYTEKLVSYGVHMTAYIANLLIKGYAAAGDIERAREVFENLSDPPEGVAAPNNHAPHDNEVVTPSAVPTSAPVYREPSTWEVMVRAELGNGNRDQAVALLERVQARRFPAAVYNRISGIMLDDSVSPWARTPELSMTDSTSS